MVLLPSLMCTATVPRGHMYHTQSTPARSLSLAHHTRGPGYDGQGVPHNPLISTTKSLGTVSSKAALLASTGSLPKDGSLAKLIANGSAKKLPSIGGSTMMSVGETTLKTTSRSSVGTTAGKTAMQQDIDGEELPTRGHAASDFVYSTWHSNTFRDCRTRSQWLSKSEARHQGEIRNIRVLGVVGEIGFGKQIEQLLVVAYQGQGRVRTYVGDASSLELEPVPDIPDKVKAKFRKYVDGHNHSFRFVAYRKPPLPAKIMVCGTTDAPAMTIRRGGAARLEGDAIAQQPSREAMTKARVAVSGHVTDSHSFLQS